MVTFVCEYCDTTLKKKQVEGHVRGRCSPGAVICIDCSSTFYGNDHKGHVTCISEQDKHWGQFAKSKKTKPIAKQPKHQQVGPSHAQHPSEAPSKNSNSDQIQIEQNKIGEDAAWRGWKNEIKQIIRENDGPIQSTRLKKKLRKIYKNKGQDEIDQEEFDRLFVEKVEKIKGISKQTYYSLV